jgi:hypothetical protein
MDSTNSIGRFGTVGSEWYTRCRSPWTRASEEQIKAATNYLKTAQEDQSVGQFKDVRYKGETIYTVYMQGDNIVELLYEPAHVAYISRGSTPTTP